MSQRRKPVSKRAGRKVTAQSPGGAKRAERKVTAQSPAGAKRAGSKAPGTFVALLRGVNVGGNKRVPMSELCGLAGELGFDCVRSYVQSGNLVFRSALAASQVEARLEAAIERHFGFAVAVIVRSAAEWKAYAKTNPFRDAEAERPHILHLALSKHEPRPGAVKALAAAAKAGERVALARGGLWIDFGGGVGRSKLTPVLLDRLVGSTVTARNFRTVQKLAELLGELEDSAA